MVLVLVLVLVVLVMAPALVLAQVTAFVGLAVVMLAVAAVGAKGVVGAAVTLVMVHAEASVLTLDVDTVPTMLRANTAQHASQIYMAVLSLSLSLNFHSLNSHSLTLCAFVVSFPDWSQNDPRLNAHE